MKIIARKFRADYKKAEIDLSEISDVRWDFVSGWSTRVYHPWPAIYIYINYNLAMEVGLSSGSHIDVAHSAKLIVQKCDNSKKPYSDAYHFLESKAGPRPE